MKHNIRRLKSLVLVTISAVMIPSPANSAPPPTQVGQCADTFIQRTGTRLVEGAAGTPVPGSGTGVKLTNGIYLVSYDEIPQLRIAQAGDKVKLCLLHIPENCPPGDNRGRIYSLLNYRTNGYVEMPDSQHKCGGA
jgi:hypothetical protein